MAISLKTRLRTYFLWTMLLLYLVARICQLYVGKIPIMWIVVLHVLPPAVFALLHGSIVYRLKGALTFAALSLGVGAVFESLSLRTGFPFGQYYFTDVMGPKLFDLPVLLALAYLGIGYLSWTLGLLILGYTNKPLVGSRVVALPLLASFIMVAWDLSMEPIWATIDRAWVWRTGGAYFGVPVSNFFGWYLTVYIFYQLFALYLKDKAVLPLSSSHGSWHLAILFYGACAAGNLLLAIPRMAPSIVTDPSGKQWMAESIVGACVLVSIFVMGPYALLAWLRMREQ